MDTRMLSLMAIAVLVVSGCTAGPTVSHTEPHGIVVITNAQPSQNNYPVVLLEIDDRNILEVQNAYWLAPGRHTLRVAAVLSTGRPILRQIRETRAEQEEHELEINIEVGKRYVIGAHRTGVDGGDWEPVVLAISDIN